VRFTELPLAPPLRDALGVRAIGDGIARRGRRADVRGPRRVKRIWRDVTGLVRPAPLVMATAAVAPAAGVAVRRHGGPVLHDVDRRGDNERGRVDASPGHMCRKSLKSVMVSLVLRVSRFNRFTVVRRRKYKQNEDARRVSLVSAI